MDKTCQRGRKLYTKHKTHQSTTTAACLQTTLNRRHSRTATTCLQAQGFTCIFLGIALAFIATTTLRSHINATIATPTAALQTPSSDKDKVVIALSKLIRLLFACPAVIRRHVGTLFSAHSWSKSPAFRIVLIGPRDAGIYVSIGNRSTKSCSSSTGGLSISASLLLAIDIGGLGTGRG